MVWKNPSTLGPLILDNIITINFTIFCYSCSNYSVNKIFIFYGLELIFNGIRRLFTFNTSLNGLQPIILFRITPLSVIKNNVDGTEIVLKNRADFCITQLCSNRIQRRLCRRSTLCLPIHGWLRVILYA